MKGKKAKSLKLFSQQKFISFYKAKMSDENRIFYELLGRVGNDGAYQTRISIIVYCLALIASSSFFINPYLFYQQPYLCNGVQSTHCTQHVCSLPLAQRQKFLAPPMISSMGNSNPTYFCKGISTVLFMEEGILVGASLGIIIGVMFSDIVGRRKTMLVAIGLGLLGVMITVVGVAPWLKFIGLVLWGSGADITFGVSLTILLDSSANENSAITLTVFAASYAIGGIINVLLFYFLKDWILVLLFYYLLAYAIALITFFCFVESPPIEIISHNSDPRQSYKAFMRIARVNSKQDHGISFEQIQRIHQEYHQNLVEKGHAHSFNCIDVCRFGSLRWDFLKISFGFSMSTLLQFGPVLLQQALLPNIFYSGIANGVALLFSIPFLGYANEKVSRRKGNMFFCLMCAIFMMAQFFFNPTGCISCLSGGKYVLMLILFFAARFFANLFGNFFFTVLMQSFPQQIKIPATGSAAGISRLGTLLIPYIPRILQMISFSFNIFFSIIALLGLLASFLIRQTFGVPPPEQIQELQLQQRESLKIASKMND